MDPHIVHVGALVAFEGDPWVIDAITATGYDLHALDNGENMTAVLFEYVEGLPVTPEYLELLGWQRTADGHFRYEGAHKHLIVSVYGSMDIYVPYPDPGLTGVPASDTPMARIHLAKDRQDKYEKGAGVLITTVHELQNLFLGISLTPLLH